VLAECWYNGAEMWFEHLAILATIVPALILGLGATWGLIALFIMFAGWGAFLVRWPQHSGKFLCATFVTGVVVLFVYFFPVWTAMPIERAGYYARMWLQGPGIRNWI
jgi:dolichyl-phosphate-mannose--protein O-mannosyl transferase